MKTTLYPVKQAIATLKSRLETVSRALDLAQTDNDEQKTEIKDLGKRLRIASSTSHGRFVAARTITRAFSFV